MSGQPFDYRMNYVDPNQAMMEGMQSAQTLRQNDLVLKQAQEKADAEKLAAEQKKIKDQQKAELVQRYLSSKDSSLLPEMILNFPEMRESVDTLIKTRGDSYVQDQTKFLGRIVPALKSGRSDVALDVLNTRMQALKNSNADPQELQTLQTFKTALESGKPEDAQQVLQWADWALAAHDPKYGETVTKMNEDARKQALQPDVAAKAKAETEKTAAEAETAQIVAANTQETIDRKNKLTEAQTNGQLSQDQYRLLMAQIAAQELALKQQVERRTAASKTNPIVKLDSGQKKTLNDANDAAMAAINASSNATELAKQLRAQGSGGGFFNKLEIKSKEILGFDSGETAIARQVNQIINSGILSNLPPGPATDRDIAIFSKGYPDYAASDAAKAEFLDTYARVQQKIAEFSELKAAWISANGHTGTLSNDIEYNGVTYPAGMTLVQVSKLRTGAKK